MKCSFLLVFTISNLVFSVPLKKRPYAISLHSLMTAVKNKELENKLNLLTNWVALVWGYEGATSEVSANVYLENIANSVLHDKNTTASRGVSYLKAMYVLRLFQIINHHNKHVVRAQWLDDEVAHLHGNISSELEKTYRREEELVTILALDEGQIASDLLVQSFASSSVHNVFEKGQQKIEIPTQYMQRSIGTLNLINKLLDPPYQLNMTIKKALSLEQKHFHKLLMKKINENFKIVILPGKLDGLKGNRTSTSWYSSSTAVYTSPTVTESDIYTPAISTQLDTARTKLAGLPNTINTTTAAGTELVTPAISSLSTKSSSPGTKSLSVGRTEIPKSASSEADGVTSQTLASVSTKSSYLSTEIPNSSSVADLLESVHLSTRIVHTLFTNPEIPKISSAPDSFTKQALADELISPQVTSALVLSSNLSTRSVSTSKTPSLRSTTTTGLATSTEIPRSTSTAYSVTKQKLPDAPLSTKSTRLSRKSATNSITSSSVANWATKQTFAIKVISPRTTSAPAKSPYLSTRLATTTKILRSSSAANIRTKPTLSAEQTTPKTKSARPAPVKTLQSFYKANNINRQTVTTPRNKVSTTKSSYYVRKLKPPAAAKPKNYLKRDGRTRFVVDFVNMH